jgi:hypothetical protein
VGRFLRFEPTVAYLRTKACDWVGTLVRPRWLREEEGHVRVFALCPNIRPTTEEVSWKTCVSLAEKCLVEKCWTRIVLSTWPRLYGLFRLSCWHNHPQLARRVTRVNTRSAQVYSEVPTKREVLHNILIEFGIPLNLVRLIKMCLNETYSRVRLEKHFSDRFPTLLKLCQ